MCSDDLIIENGVLVEYYGLEDKVIIPDEVKVIGEDAFSTSGVAQVLIHDGVTEIADGAFNYSDIKKIVIPDSVTSLGKNAFQSCFKLSAIGIGNGIRNIDDFCFEECCELTTVVIPASVKRIGEKAFSGCVKLERIIIPDSVTEIDSSAFDSCDDLTVYCSDGSYAHHFAEEHNIMCSLEKNLSDIVESFDADEPFTDFLIVKDVLTKYVGGGGKAIIPDGVTVIGENSFAFSEISDVEMPDSVTEIGQGAFQCCFELTAVRIGNGVRNIGKFSFDGCNGLSTVIISPSVKKIDAYAFFNCSNLISVVIPDSVTEIDGTAFDRSIATIYCSEGSYAHRYAVAYNLQYSFEKN